MTELEEQQLKEKLSNLTYEEKKEILLLEAKRRGVRPTMIQKEFGISLSGGRKSGSKNTNSEIWAQLTHEILNGLADKYLLELSKLEGEPFLRHYEVILQYMKPKAPVDLNINVQNKIMVGFEEDEDDNIIKTIEEE